MLSVIWLIGQAPNTHIQNELLFYIITINIMYYWMQKKRCPLGIVFYVFKSF